MNLCINTTLSSVPFEYTQYPFQRQLPKFRAGGMGATEQHRLRSQLVGVWTWRRCVLPIGPWGAPFPSLNLLADPQIGGN